MATSRSDRRRRTSAGSSNNRAARSSSPEDRRPLQGRDTGYRVGGGGRRPSNNQGINQRLVIVGIIGVALLILLIFGVSSCIRSCSSSRPQESTTNTEVNAQDDRVAAGVSAEETSRLSEALDRNETFAKLAANADKITDARLIDLALAEPEAISFVYGSIKADGSTEAFSGTLTTGEYPKLYTFDKRWGYLAFGDGILGVTGSGPVALAVASMGLSGTATHDPATVAQAVIAAQLATGSSGMDDAFVSSHANEAGLVATAVDVSSEGIYAPLSQGQPVIIRLQSGSGVGSENAHWALITSLNEDNSVSVFDPTSVAASSHSWSLGAVSAVTEAAFSLTADTSTTTADDGTTEGGDATTDGTATDGTTTDATGDNSGTATGTNAESSTSVTNTSAPTGTDADSSSSQ